MNGQQLALVAIAGVIIGWISANGEEKSQAVRLLDVLVLGPGLLFASFAPAPPAGIRAAMAFVGGATVGYNARNFAKARRPPA